MGEFKRTLVTSALPYANGPLHIGHIAGAYLPGDIFVRYSRLKGDDIVYICGTDEYGVPITISADKEGKTPQDIVDHFYPIIKDSFEKLGIKFDNFSRTTNPIHTETAQDFFLKFIEKDYLVKRESERDRHPGGQRLVDHLAGNGGAGTLRLKVEIVGHEW